MSFCVLEIKVEKLESEIKEEEEKTVNWLNDTNEKWFTEWVETSVCARAHSLPSFFNVQWQCEIPINGGNLRLRQSHQSKCYWVWLANFLPCSLCVDSVCETHRHNKHLQCMTTSDRKCFVKCRLSRVHVISRVPTGIKHAKMMVGSK